MKPEMFHCRCKSTQQDTTNRKRPQKRSTFLGGKILDQTRQQSKKSQLDTKHIVERIQDPQIALRDFEKTTPADTVSEQRSLQHNTYLAGTANTLQNESNLYGLCMTQQSTEIGLEKQYRLGSSALLNKVQKRYSAPRNNMILPHMLCTLTTSANFLTKKRYLADKEIELETLYYLGSSILEHIAIT